VTAKAQVRVALPWLHEAIAEARAADTLSEIPSLCWLAGRGRFTRAPQADWREWLLGGDAAATLAEFRRWPAGPSLAAAVGAHAGTAPGWAIAQPVHLAAGLDHVRIAPIADAVPTVAEADQIAAALRGHFADDMFDLADFTDGAWLVRCAERIECATHDPVALAGCNIHDFLPDGPDGGRVRTLMNEIQMVLHDHPVNQRRTSTRALPINALWLWGFGASDLAPRPIEAAAGRALYSDDLWLRSFWRAHGGTERALRAAGTKAGNALIGMAQPPTTEPTESMAEVDKSLLSRLAHMVQGGLVRTLDVHDGVRVLSLDRHSRWRFWRLPVSADAL
jgi:hypothetical protein